MNEDNLVFPGPWEKKAYVRRLDEVVKVSDKKVPCRVQARKKKVANFRNSQKMHSKVSINLPHGLSSSQPIWAVKVEADAWIWSLWKLRGQICRG